MADSNEVCFRAFLSDDEGDATTVSWSVSNWNDNVYGTFYFNEKTVFDLYHNDPEEKDEAVYRHLSDVDRLVDVLTAYKRALKARVKEVKKAKKDG